MKTSTEIVKFTSTVPLVLEDLSRDPVPVKMEGRSARTEVLRTQQVLKDGLQEHHLYGLAAAATTLATIACVIFGIPPGFGLILGATGVITGLLSAVGFIGETAEQYHKSIAAALTEQSLALNKVDRSTNDGRFREKALELLYKIRYKELAVGPRAFSRRTAYRLTRRDAQGRPTESRTVEIQKKRLIVSKTTYVSEQQAWLSAFNRALGVD